jgi:hypothetical protein
VTDWLVGFDLVPGNSSGEWAADDEDAPKGVLHTTEGMSFAAALGAYRDNNSWPHVTVDPVNRRRWQHVALDRPARALRNTGTGGQTNREGRVYQVEILGFAGRTHTWSDSELEWLGKWVVGPMSRATGIPLTSSVRFYGEDAGFTLASTTAPQRLSARDWDTYTGWLGHQHVPENTHWDPGALNVARILDAARGGTTPTPAPQANDQEPPSMMIYREQMSRGYVWVVDHAAGTRRHIARDELDALVAAGGVRHQDPEAEKGWNPPAAKVDWLHDLEDVS